LPAGRRVEITRVFDAPRDLVWEAWTRPERFVQWWGPRDFTTPMCEIDLRPGGRLRFLMRPKEGSDIWCGGVFQQVEAPSKLVFTDYFTKESGEVAFPTECGLSEEWPVQALVTVILEDLGGKTRLTLGTTPAAACRRNSRAPSRVGARASTASGSCSRANETRFRRRLVRTGPRRLRGLRRNSSPRNPSTSRRRPEAGADTTANLVQPEWYSPPV
jgi:uncharacterized protein YndB with AHSA1/START domain